MRSHVAELRESPNPLTYGSSNKASSYPESEVAYFRRRYGSDNYHQLVDRHQGIGILRFARDASKRAELEVLIEQLRNLPCVNDPEIRHPGRSAVSLAQLRKHLDAFLTPSPRPLRWNEHYRSALDYVAQEVKSQCLGTALLQPMDYQDVVQSGAITKNLDKNAGYFGFQTGKRSKGENLSEALEWVLSNKDQLLDAENYNIPLVMAHRSSNSKPSGNGWKWKCRIILMQDIRALILDGRFAVPFAEAFKSCAFGEGSMTQDQVASWIQIARSNYTHFFSSDYSQFDVNEAGWCIEDIFNYIIKPCFALNGPDDEHMFNLMVQSYIHKDIHSFNGTYHADKANVSGSLLTYVVNTLYNRLITVTILKMMGCDVANFHSLLCGDDNLTYYRNEPDFNVKTYCDLVLKYFGIKTTIEDSDYGLASVNPKFLSRVWTWGGQERDIKEVIFNLLFPERFREYSPKVTGVSEERAVALVLYCAYIEQSKTMGQWFDFYKIQRIAGVSPGRNAMEPYEILATLGSGFKTQWINWQIDQGTMKVSA